MTPIKVSILLPAHNAEGTLRDAVESLLNQTYPNFDIWIIENGSEDSTWKISKDLARSPKVNAIRLDQANIVPALNAGYKESRSELIARMDADDISSPDRLDQQIEFLNRHPEIDVVGSLVAFGGNRDSAQGYAHYIDWTNSLVDHESISLNRFVESPMVHPSILFRRSTADRFGLWHDGDFPEDYELWLRWLNAGVRFAKVPDVLLRWNDPPERLSRTDPRYGSEPFFRLKAQYLAAYLKTNQLTHKPIYVWGAGKLARKRANYLHDHGIEIKAWIDIDPGKIGKELGGVKVISSQEIPRPETQNAFILSYVSNRNARPQIVDTLERRGYRLGVNYLCVA